MRLISTVFITGFTGVLAALFISACQPKSDETVNSAASDASMEQQTGNPTDDHAINHVANHSMDRADSHSTPHEADMSQHTHQAMTSFGQEYHDGMMTMHEAMMVGMSANDADVAFAKSMLAHHQGAVAMAETQLKYGKDEQMNQLAKDIIDAQQKEIEQMQKWLNSHPDTEAQPNTQAMQQAYEQSMGPMNSDMMDASQDSDADMAFAKGMLAHHQSAVAMAKVQLEYGKDEQMNQLAKDIIKAQQSEIEVMQSWISSHNA